MTAAEEYENRVKVAIEKAYVTDVNAQILLDGVVKILNYQDAILKNLSLIYREIKELHSDLPT